MRFVRSTSNTKQITTNWSAMHTFCSLLFTSNKIHLLHQKKKTKCQDIQWLVYRIELQRKRRKRGRKGDEDRGRANKATGKTKRIDKVSAYLRGTINEQRQLYTIYVLLLLCFRLLLLLWKCELGSLQVMAQRATFQKWQQNGNNKRNRSNSRICCWMSGRRSRVDIGSSTDVCLQIFMTL